MDIKRARRLLALRLISLLVLTPIAGCATSKSVDLVAGGDVRVDRTNSNLLDLSLPIVRRQGHIVIISGVVTRKPGVDGPIPRGHVQIFFISKDGAILDELSPMWIPSDIPVSGDRQSTYEISYGWLPPEGTLVRAVYSDHQHLGEMSSGGAASTGNGPRTAGNTSMSRTMGSPTGPMTGRR